MGCCLTAARTMHKRRKSGAQALSGSQRELTAATQGYRTAGAPSSPVAGIGAGGRSRPVLQPVEPLGLRLLSLARSPLLGLAGLAGGVAGIARRLALGCLRGVADHLLDGLPTLTRLTLGPLGRLALGPGSRLSLLLRLAGGFPPRARLCDAHALLTPLDNVRIILRGLGLEPLHGRLPCIRRLLQAVGKRLLLESLHTCPSVAAARAPLHVFAGHQPLGVPLGVRIMPIRSREIGQIGRAHV